MVNALDYRYFDSCHIDGSINFWGSLLYCELRAAEQSHPQVAASANADVALARNSLAELEKFTRGRSLHNPLQNMTAALAAQRPVVLYCANPS